MHPYHYELGDFGPADTQTRRRGCQAASKTTRRVIHTLVGNMRSHQLKPQGPCVVVSSLVDPLKVAREHPRVNAQEGKLYREAVEAELSSCRVPFITVVNKDLLTFGCRPSRTNRITNQFNPQGFFERGQHTVARAGETGSCGRMDHALRLSPYQEHGF